MLAVLRRDRGRSPSRRRSTRTHVAHTDPFPSNLDGTTIVDGKTRPGDAAGDRGLGLGVTPIGPTWDPRHYFLGADNQGRDVAARLLYGGRNSLLIGFAAAAAHLLARHADRRRRRLLRRLRRRCPLAPAGRRLGVPGLPARDLPLGRADHAAGSSLGPVAHRAPAASGCRSSSSASSTSRTWRDRSAARCCRCAEREFVEAAIGLGASTWRLLWSEILPERGHDGDRLLPAHDGDRHAHRGGAVVPLDRRAAAGRELGHDHPRRPGLLYTRPAVALAPGLRDRADGARAQRPRRRHPRRARPAREATGRSPDAALRRCAGSSRCCS